MDDVIVCLLKKKIKENQVVLCNQINPPIDIEHLRIYELPNNQSDWTVLVNDRLSGKRHVSFKLDKVWAACLTPPERETSMYRIAYNPYDNEILLSKIVETPE